MTVSHRRLHRLVLALAAGALVASAAAGQSPDWSSMLIISPSPSPYLSDWERVPSTALLTLTYTGVGATDFKVRVTLTSTERGTIGTTESPSVTLAGGPSSFLYSVRDAVFEWTTVSRNSAVTDAATRTGQIPEGSYRACARVFVGTATTPATEACADFSIFQPDPPQLVAPQDRDVVVSTQPFFQWTPVLAPPTVPVSYELTVVELLGTQVPRTALDANIPVFRATATTPFLIYPIDALPLEHEKRYAWRVRAVDAEGQQLFRDGAQSEIWTFEMSDELLRPVGKVADLPDTVVLLPGVAQLTGLRSARLRRTETEVEIDGPLRLEFLGAAGIPSQSVNAQGLRAGFRGDELSLLAGRIEVAVPSALIPAELRPFLTFAPLVFTPASGFTATASLRIPGQPAVPLSGAVQLTGGGLFGRLEGARAGGVPIARIGNAPVQYAANTARLTLPAGRLEFGGSVLLFEQDVGCPAAGELVGGVVRLPVFCDPTSGFRPDTSSSRSLLTFGTLAGTLAADFQTDTLGTELRSPATFSVLGQGNAACGMQFTMVFHRGEITREDEQQSCAIDAATRDYGWVKLALSNLRITRLEYAPGATLVWRALVDLEPTVRGADNLQLATIRDVLLDNAGVHLPTTSSAEPGTSTFGIVELDGVTVVPRTMGFRGGLVKYRDWFADEDPGLEWGSATSWIRFEQITNEVTRCVTASPFEVDTLILKAGALDAPLRRKTWETGCRLHAGPNINLDVRSVGGRVRIALDPTPRVTDLPLVEGGFVHPKPDCGIPVIGCIELLNFSAIDGELRLTQTGRLRGIVSGFKPSWAEFALKFAKLKLTGGRLALGVDSTGAQTGIYDGDVTVDFNKIVETKKEEPKKEGDAAVKPPDGAVAGAGGAAKAVGVGLPGSDDLTVTTVAQVDVVNSRLLAGSFVLKGPFTLKMGFFTFIVADAVLDTTGLSIDGRQRLLVERTTAETAKPPAAKQEPDPDHTPDATTDRGDTRTDAQKKADAEAAAAEAKRLAEEKKAADEKAAAEAKAAAEEALKDTTWSTVTDTIDVTFAKVRLDPETGEVGSGTITLAAGLGLESTAFGIAARIGLAAGIGAITGGEAGAGKGALDAVDDAGVFAFTLVKADAPFDPKNKGLNQVAGGNIRLNLPGTPTIDSRGMRLSGVAPSRVAVIGKRFDEASVSFEGDFAIRPVAATVAQGRALVRLKEYPIAYADRSGWHIALAELVATLIPDRLYLFDQNTAYIELRNSAHELLVDVVETESGPRIKTKPGTAVLIVIPALKGSRAAPPQVQIAMDVTLERGTWRPLEGEITASTSGRPEDDFSDNGIPFKLDSVIFRMARGGSPSFLAHGRIDVWPGQSKPMKVALGFLGDGELIASADQAFDDAVPLVEGSDLVSFKIDALRFSARGKFASGFVWSVDLPGHLGYHDPQKSTEDVLASATFHLSATEAALVDFQATALLATLQLPGVELRLGRIRAPTFRFDFAAKRFDFELMFDVGLRIPALDDLELPEIRDIRITPQGLVIPAFEMASIPVAQQGNPFVTQGAELRVGGFSVKPLAFRVSEFRWNWFEHAPPPQFNFGVDLEFGIEDLPSAVEGQAARIALRALNVGITNGRFTGSFEPLEIPVPIRTPVADIRGAFGSFKVGNGEPAEISIGVIADLRLPELMNCPTAELRSVSLENPGDTLFLSSNGTLRGSIHGLLPRCPMALGPFDLAFGQSIATFGYDPGTQRVTALLDASATLTVPGDQPGETVSATGRIVLDLANARVADASIALAQPFSWSPDPANPFLKLIVNEASLTQQELRFGATGKLRTDQGAGVDVAFENVAFSLNTLRLTSGQIRITADAAIGIEIPDDGSLQFGVYPVSTPRGATASARLVLPTGALIDSTGVHITGSATASLGFGGETYASLTGTFVDDFTIGFAPTIAITSGRLNLTDAADQLIAYANPQGFWPGNVFAVLPIPARLGLPSEDVAFIQLRNPNNLAQVLVSTEFGPETVRLFTPPGMTVEVVIPGLARGGPVPVVQASFDLTLNSRTMVPVAGELQLTAAPKQSLIPLQGLPIAITQLGFRAEQGGFKLRAGARATLPAALNEVNLEFRNIEITNQGLTGVVELGDYSETFNPNAVPIVSKSFLGDTLTLAFTGAELTLAGANTVVRLSGAIRSAMLELPNGGTRTIALTATVDGAGFRSTVAVSDPETPLKIGVAEFTLESAPNDPALIVEANAQEFALTLGGSIRLPTIAPGFSLAVRAFKVGTAGVRIPDVSITAPANTKEFDLFGARFALKDSVEGTTQVAPAIGIQLAQGAVRFTFSGYVTMLANTTRFIGLRFGTDGTFSLQGASFLSRPIDIVPNVARLVSANITNGGLELTGDVKLPAPFTQGAPQVLMVRIMPDGQVTGGGKIVVVSEQAGLATATKKLNVGIATFHLRHLDLTIDLASASNTAVAMVADIYVQSKAENLLRFGAVNGGVVTPGLRIAVNGNVTFGGLTMPNPITLDMDPVRLTFADLTSNTTPEGWEVLLRGSVGLKVSGVTGGLDFRNVGFTSAGAIRIGAASFDGGVFKVQNTITLTVGGLHWSDSDTTIAVPVANPPNAKGEITQGSEQVAVSSFIDLGASVDIAGVFAGGVDRFLVYVKQDDATTHFLVQNLFVKMPGIIEFHASMKFDEYPDGFEFALTADGYLLSVYRIGMVGVLARHGDQFRAGVFLRSSVTIPLVPGILTLTEIGGGLFINPTPGDLQLVKNVAGLNGASANRVGMPPAGKFAVMLYAGFAVAGANGASAASGRALVTITDMAFQINATAAFFKMEEKITGDLALQVGWTPAVYVRGDISLDISIPKTVKGTASIQFFAGSNLFAIKGNLDLMIVEVIQASAEVIIVPSGFTARLGLKFEIKNDFVGLKIEGLLRIWYRPSTSDLGAYLKLTGAATALGITGELGLIGALVIQPELAVYGQGWVRIVGVPALTFGVWVQYTSRGVEAGLGMNEELARVIARAEQIAQDLEDEADAILAGIDASQRALAAQQTSVSDESLARAYANFQRWKWYDIAIAWGAFRVGEGISIGGLMSVSSTDTYGEFYRRILTSSAAAADTALVTQLREEARQKLAVIADRRDEVEERIRGLKLELAAAEAASAYIPPEDPVTAWDPGKPSLVEGSARTADGRPVMELRGAPEFELDDKKATEARQTMDAAKAATVARPERLREQLAAVETGLATVIAATSASDPNSFASYAKLHSDAVDVIEHQYAVNVDFRMRRRTWAQGVLDTLARERPALETGLATKLDGLVTYWVGRPPEYRSLPATARGLDSLAKHRARTLAGWSGDASILTGYEAAAQSQRSRIVADSTTLRASSTNVNARQGLIDAANWFKGQAQAYGLQAWWGVANAGLTQARDGAQASIDEANTAAVTVIADMRSLHARMTSDLVELNTRQADLFGVLYDLYDAYLRTYGATDAEVARTFTARKAELAAMLQAPSVTNPRVTVTDFGYLSSVSTTWTGTHPRGVYEYLLQEGSGDLVSIGAQGSARRWVYTTDAAGGTSPRNQTVSVRGGAGFTGSTRTPYSVSFLRGSASDPHTEIAIPPVDATAPGAPVISFSDLTQIIDFGSGSVFWTGDSSRIAARWTATDLESGIAEYEYRVLSSPVPTASSGTQSMFMVSKPPTAPVVLLPWTSAGGRTSVTLQGFVIPANRHVSVEVRATNGAGLVGPVGTSGPVRFDPTPPVFPTGTVLSPMLQAMTTFFVSGFPIVGTFTPMLPVCGSYAVALFGTGPAPKVWSGKLVTVTPTNAVVGGGARPRLGLTRPTASDVETGIAGYYYRVSATAPSATVPIDGWIPVTETGTVFTATGPDFAWGQPRWVSLVAQNGAGKRSQPVNYGPITMTDASTPNAPAFCGDYGSGGFIAYMTAPSTDDETGILGYQMRVKGPTGAVVRPFPAGTAVDWPASLAGADRAIRVPFVPSVGGRHLVELRAVNGGGGLGEIATSGEVLFDVTPAPSPGVTAIFLGTQAVLNLTLYNDPESGLGGLDIALGNSNTDPTLTPTAGALLFVPWTSSAAIVGSSQRTFALPPLPGNMPIFAYVRVRNGAGLVTAATIVRVR